MPTTRAKKRKGNLQTAGDKKKIKNMVQENLPGECMAPVIHLQSEDLEKGGFQKILTKYSAFFKNFPLVILRGIPVPGKMDNYKKIKTEVTYQTFVKKGSLTEIMKEVTDLTVAEFLKGKKAQGDEKMYIQNYPEPGDMFNLKDWALKWNLSNGDETGLNSIGLKEFQIKGVTTPYSYIGREGSKFPWHVEDMDLWSLNIHCGGDPKVWEGISIRDSKEAYEVLQNQEPSINCNVWWRHKRMMVDMEIFRKAGIHVYKAVQEEGDAVVTSFFHQGENKGENYNIAVNCFPANKNAEALGKAAMALHCQKDCQITDDLSHVLPLEPFRDIVCQTCGQVCKSEEGWRNHAAGECQATRPEVECLICFKKQKSLYHHYNESHKEVTQVCPLCRDAYSGSHAGHFKQCTKICHNPECSFKGKKIKSHLKALKHSFECKKEEKKKDEEAKKD